jgi:lysophospholipase L1-like esterase
VQHRYQQPKTMKHLVLVIVVISLSFAAQAFADSPAAGTVIFDMDSVQHKPAEITNNVKQKVPAGTADLVEGKFGQAVKFTFVEGANGGFMMGRVRPTEHWDRAQGFSFWVKGDGSRTWGGIELIDRDDFSLRYGYCFPIDSTEWRKIVVPWRDVVPELSGPLVGGKDGFAPSKFGNFFFGKWFYWRDFPAQSYAIDQVALEPAIGEEPAPAVSPGLARVRAKLKEHKPITIVTMGDSLTDERHWSNRQVVWHHLFAEALKTKYGSEVKVVNPAMGGTTLSQNLVVMPRWAPEAPSPDLVTVWFGGNDWDSNVRGPRFADYLRLAVDRIGRQAGGKADILVMTTCPTHARWETMKEMEQAVRDVGMEKQVAVADVAAAFRKAGSADEALKQEYFAWDKVHLGRRGHEVARDVVMEAIGGRGDPVR